MWCRPEPSSVSPMYMPGRLRTASRPLSTLMESAPYSGEGTVWSVIKSVGEAARCGTREGGSATAVDGRYPGRESDPRQGPQDIGIRAGIARKSGGSGGGIPDPSTILRLRLRMVPLPMTSSQGGDAATACLLPVQRGGGPREAW